MTSEQAHQRLKELADASQADPASIELMIDAVCRAVAALHGCSAEQPTRHIAAMLEELSAVVSRMSPEQQQWWRGGQLTLRKLANLVTLTLTTCELHPTQSSFSRLLTLETRWARMAARRRLL